MSDSSLQQLIQFEQSVYDPSKRGLRRSAAQLHNILSGFHVQFAATENVKQSLFYPRLAAAINALLLDSAFQMSLSEFQLLCASHAKLANVFACTDWRTADHIISNLANIDDIENIRFSNVHVLMKCLLCYSLESDYQLDIHALAEQFPDIVAAVVLGQLSCDMFSSAKIEHRINQLLSQHWEVFDQVTPSLPMTLITSNAWMNCSYSNVINKHLIKKNLNAMIRNGLQASSIDESRVARYIAKKTRPRMVVPLEIFTSIHAMYRCFERVIANLQQQFDVIAVAPNNCIDARAEQLFPRVIKFDPAKTIGNIAPLVEQIQELQPDIVYYPSLGMANYSLMLANLRLAPVQCFTLGHPATSYIETIDYAIVQQQDFTDASVFSETVVLTANETSATINRVLESIPSPEIRETCEQLTIAVTSKHMKINHAFLNLCKRIEEQSSKPLHFNFFPGTNGFHLEFVRQEIQNVLPGSSVFPTTDYDTYISNMNQCDLRLGTFPFGGANTNMDCFGLGIPFVILDGLQPHSHSDTAQLEQSGLPDWLIAQDQQEYIAAALRLIENDAERLDLSRQMMQLHQNDFFYKNDQSKTDGFNQTMTWLFQNHQRIQNTDQRVWSLADQQVEP